MFNANSEIVKDYALLIKNKEKTINDVPDFDNLREVVANVLAQS
ncbi:MAG: CD1375 family protein [Lysinibacillus sp.]